VQRDSGLLAVAVDPPLQLSGSRVVTATIVAVFAWIVAWYWPTAREIGHIWWRSDTFAHGLAVIPIFAWLVWQKRDRLEHLSPMPAPALAPLLLLAGFAWIVGQMVSVASLAHASVVVMVVTGMVAVMGWRLSRVLAFPLLFLFFGVPIGEFLLPWLMRYTAEFTVWAVRLSGVPVYQEGLHFVVPNGRWSVVEACSGIRYLIASLMVGTLYAYLNYRSLRRRLLFVGVAIAVPIIANWLRAYLIVMLGYLSGNRLAVGVDHLIYGWAFFGVVIMAMFWIGARWREDAVEAPSTVKPALPTAATRRWLGVLPLALATMIFPLALQQLDEPVAPFSVSLATPAPAAGWTLVDDSFQGYRPHFKGHRGELFQAYRRDDGKVIGLYVAYYARQQPGNELVMWSNALIAPGDKRWTQLASREDVLPVGEVRRALVTNQTSRLAIWNWYHANRRVVKSDYFAKALFAIDRLSSQPDDAAFIALISPVEERAEEARELTEAFLREHAREIEAMLERAEARP